MTPVAWIALVFAGLAAAVLALALGPDLVGRLALAAGKLFRTGDRVRIGSEEGRVLEIGLRATRVRTRDGGIVVVPHRRVLSDVVANFDARGGAARVVAETALPTDVDPAEAREIAREAAVSSRFVRLDAPVEVSLEGRTGGAPAYLLRVRARAVDAGDADALRTEILEGLHGALRERGRPRS